LFEGPFKAKLVNSNEYLIELCCYIHANPIKSGLVKHAEDWPYSDLVEWIRQDRTCRSDGLNRVKIFDTPRSYLQIFNEYLHRTELPKELGYLEDY
jgi:hypothetical protein